MFFKKPDFQLKQQKSTGIFNREPLTIRVLKNRSQEIFNQSCQINKEPTAIIQPKKWTLKKLLNIVDQQQQAISSSRFFQPKYTKGRQTQSQDKSKDKSEVMPVYEERFIEEKVGDSARIRLVKFLSFHRAGSVEKAKQKLNFSQIKQDNNNSNNTKKRIVLKLNTSRLKEATSHNNSISDTRSQLRDIKQKISNIISATDRKIIVSYTNVNHQKVFTKRKNPKTLKRLRRIAKEVIEVVRYIQKNKLWFCYPISYNRTFLQKIIDKQFEQVKNELHTDPQLVHMRNQHGQTPLHLACIQNNFALIKLFTQYQSYLNALDTYELTPLFYSLQQNSAICIKLLLDSNASPWSPSGQRIDLNKCTSLTRDMVNQSRLQSVVRLWKREVRIKKIVKQFTSKK